MSSEKKHFSGFVNIMGKPNAGKSTLMNALLDEKLSVVTHKPQTTRHRILGIWNDADHQIVYSDTPGLIDDPGYDMQKVMNKYALSALEDADILLFVVDSAAPLLENDRLFQQILGLAVPTLLLLNKIDLCSEAQLNDIRNHYQNWFSKSQIMEISASKHLGIDELQDWIIENLPEGPVYYPKDQLSDKNQRFFVSEIIRGKALLLYKQEVPYSIEVIVESFKEEESRSGPMIHIQATIYVARKTQKAILIGKNGKAIKNLGTEARKSIEEFLDQKVFLELYVKVKENWRDDERSLKYFGYQ